MLNRLARHHLAAPEGKGGGPGGNPDIHAVMLTYPATPHRIAAFAVFGGNDAPPLPAVRTLLIEKPRLQKPGGSLRGQRFIMSAGGRRKVGRLFGRKGDSSPGEMADALSTVTRAAVVRNKPAHGFSLLNSGRGGDAAAQGRAYKNIYTCREEWHSSHWASPETDGNRPGKA